MMNHETINRRLFLAVAATGVAAAQSIYEWGGPVLDMHLHYRAEDDNFAHIEGSGVTVANLLTQAQADSGARAAMEKHPGRYLRSISADIAEPDGIALMRQCVNGGAIGLGEIKFKLAIDSPEMRDVYALAGELDVPVTIHFQDDSGGGYSAPLKGLPAILKAYPKTRIIGHANAFWANISANVPAGVGYPTGRVKSGGLTDTMLSEYPNLYADLSANSGRNAIDRDPDFASGFLARHRGKVLFGSDCPCTDGRGAGQTSQAPLIKGRCVARETLTALKQLTSPEDFRMITWENARRLLKVSA